MRIPYGQTELNLPLEDLLGPPDVIWPSPNPPELTEEEILEAGESWISQRAEVADGTRDVPWARLLAHLPAQAHRPVLVVPDATRKGVWQDLLPSLAMFLIERWHSAKLTLLVANGIHKEVDAQSLRKHLERRDVRGLLARALDDERIVAVQHNAGGSLEKVGETRRGTSIELNPLYKHSDVRVLLGGTSYHYFAGFGGGPKLIFPGVGGHKGILANHLLALDETTGSWTPACSPSLLEGNPVAEDLAEGASMEPPDAMVLALGLPGDRLAASTWSQSNWLSGFKIGCSLYKRLHEIPLGGPLDGVIADAGGEPRDNHLLQVHKSLQHAVRFLKPGGWVLLAGACRDGEGSAHLVDLVEALQRGSVQRGESFHLQSAVALRWATQGRTVAFLSQLSQKTPDRVRTLGWQPLPNEKSALEWLKSRSGSRWGRLREADTVLPVS
jgi:nickel-dependent lactate racemase